MNASLPSSILPGSGVAGFVDSTPAVEPLRVLLLGGEPAEDEAVMHVLARAGYAPSAWRVRGREEFSAALQVRPDVVLASARVDGFDGLEALEHLQSVGLDTPVLLLSGRVDEAEMLTALRRGVADCVRRDRLDRLGLAVARALERRRLRAEHTAARQALADSEANLRLILDSLPAAAYTCDAEGRITYYNREAARAWGREPRLRDAEERFCGSHRMLDAGGEAVARENCWMARALRENRAQLGRDAIVERPDGSRRHLIANVSPLRATDGRMVGAVNVLIDVTELRELREQFLRAQRLEGLGMLAAGIAHDLNNILSPLLMATPLLRLHLSDPADMRIVETIEMSTRRGAALVRQILDFAHGSTGEVTVMQPRHVLREMVTVVEGSFPKTITLEKAIEANLWTIRANPTQIHQVLLNLCLNARDAMGGVGVLRLAAHNLPAETTAPATATDEAGGGLGDRVVLEVGDSGPGIPPEVLARMWEPFFTTKAAGKGTGLGLSTVRGIVEAHGGRVEVETAPGRGALFRVILPAAE